MAEVAGCRLAVGRLVFHGLPRRQVGHVYHLLLDVGSLCLELLQRLVVYGGVQ